MFERRSITVELLVGILIYFVLFSIIFYLSKLSEPYPDILIAALSGIIASIIAVVIQSRWNTMSLFDKLYREITENCQKMSDEKICKEFDRMRIIHQKVLNNTCPTEWVGFRKIIQVYVLLSDQGERRDQYRYLSSNVYRQFINKGCYSHLDQETIDNLVWFYLQCERFSVQTQNIEKQIILNRERFFYEIFPNLTDENRNDSLNLSIGLMQNLHKNFQPQINKLHQSLKEKINF